MKYISTRGRAPALNFEDVILTGMASDGGLYVPESLPQFSREDIASWANLDYEALAFKVMWPFVEGDLSEKELQSLIAASYKKFRHKAIAPLVQTDANEWVLELFHGPTLAFKDFALQFLGHLLDLVLKKRKQKVVILGATSGDTGSAAIEGCRDCDNVDIFILHPHQKVSDVQRQQMTTVQEDNVHNIAIKGNFDDCQNIVKRSFADQGFLPKGRQLVAVNSINWSRIMAQIVYYFYAALSVGGPHRKVSFSVPTGNFGDIFAGYLAKQMGLPIERLIIATNSNDILHRCLSANDHSKQALQHSLSPSMDIMVSSNFERLLFDLYDRDGAAIQQLMDDFQNGSMHLSDAALVKARELFGSARVDDANTKACIAKVYQENAYLLDPHSAIGVQAAREQKALCNASPLVCLATAHPAKFPDAIVAAGVEESVSLPLHMQDLAHREERCTVLENEASAVQQFICTNLNT